MLLKRMISSTFAWATREVFWKVMEIEVLEVTVVMIMMK
jgi:hypothetical protein